ncbi:MAG: hypothetical protein ACPGAN_07315 [Candidatus Poseidoniaceae archaeon]
MDGRKPRLALICRIIGLFILAYVLLNAFAGIWFFIEPSKKFLLTAYILQNLGLTDDPYWVPLAWTAQDTILMVVMGLIFLVARWAGTEPPVPELNNLSSTEMIENLESTNVQIKQITTTGQTSQLARDILKEVLGETQTVDQEKVVSAIDNLGEGTIENYQSQKGEVRDRTAEFDDKFSSLNVVREQEIEKPKSDNNLPLPSSYNKTKGANIGGLPVVESLPLPMREVEKEPEFTVTEVAEVKADDELTMPDLGDLIGEVNQMLDVEVETTAELENQLEIPNLDDLVLDEVPKGVEIPEIPDLDDIL